MHQKQILKNKNGKTHILHTLITSDGEISARKVTCGKINVLYIDLNKYEIIDYDENKINCQQCLKFKHSVIYYPKDRFL